MRRDPFPVAHLVFVLVALVLLAVVLAGFAGDFAAQVRAALEPAA